LFAKNSQELQERNKRIVKDENKIQKNLQKGALSWSKEFDWKHSRELSLLHWVERLGLK